jgi:hypothetical protein
MFSGALTQILSQSQNLSSKTYGPKMEQDLSAKAGEAAQSYIF